MYITFSLKDKCKNALRKPFQMELHVIKDLQSFLKNVWIYREEKLILR